MAERKMVPLPNTHYTVELRSGRVITIDEGLVFKHLVPCVEYEDMVDELREQFITHKCACYQHGVINKDGIKIQVVSFFTIQNKLLNGHRVLEVGVADITDIIEKRAAECCCEE